VVDSRLEHERQGKGGYDENQRSQNAWSRTVRYLMSGAWDILHSLEPTTQSSPPRKEDS
jgi:hypothetical protein